MTTKPTTPNRKPRLFLSYARADDEPFVRRLLADLMAAGFDAWFDKNDLRSRGLTFLQEIKDAIRERDRLIYIGGPNAVRSPFVRMEWELAIELEKPVIPVIRLGTLEEVVTGSLSFLHCDDFSDDAQYAATFAKLLRNLNEPPAPLGRLLSVPELPPQFLGRPELMKRVKAALLVDLQQPTPTTSGPLHVAVQGMGGIGKSVLAAAISRDQEIRRSYPDGVMWVRFGKNPDVVRLQRDVFSQFGKTGRFDHASDGKTQLRELLFDKSILLVLDNVWRARDVLDFVELGPRCRALITVRNLGVIGKIAARYFPIELFTEEESLRLLANMTGVSVESLPPEAREVVQKCGRLALALALSAGMANNRGGKWADVVERLRRADLEKIADREPIEEQHRNLWVAMHASVEDLAPEQRQRFIELSVFDPAGSTPLGAVETLWKETGSLEGIDSRDLLYELRDRALVNVDPIPRTNGSNQTERFSLHDLLYDYTVRVAGDPVPLHRSLLDSYKRRCSKDWPSGPNDGYFFQNLQRHLFLADRGIEAVDLLMDFDWVQAKSNHGLIYSLICDYEDAQGKTCHVRTSLLPLLIKALRWDASFIAEHPRLLLQCLWHSCYWYDAPEAPEYYEWDSLTNRDDPDHPWNRPKEKLSKLMSQWLCVSRRNCCEPWLRSNRPAGSQLASGLIMIIHGQDVVNAAVYSPDGFRIVTSSDDGARVWDALTGRQIAVFQGQLAKFALDGTLVVTASGNAAFVWDASTGRQVAALRGHRSDNTITSVDFSPDGSLVVTGSYDATSRVWEVTTGRQVAMLDRQQGPSYLNGWVLSVAFSPNGSRVVRSEYDRDTARVWNFSTGEQIVLCGHSSNVVSATFSPDGLRVVTASFDNTARVWDAATGQSQQVLLGHTNLVTSAAFSPDGLRVVTASSDASARVWEVSTGRLILLLKGHTGRVRTAAFSPDGSRIVTADHLTARVWDASNGRQMTVLQGHLKGIASAQFSPDGLRVLTGSSDHTARVWDASTNRPTAYLKGHTSSINFQTYVFSADGFRFVTGAHDKTARVWDVESGRQLAVLQGHEESIRTVTFSLNSTRVGTGSWDNTARVWDAATGQPVSVLQGHKGLVSTVVFSADGSLVVTGSTDKTARVWNATTGQKISEYRFHDREVSLVVISPNNSRVVTGSSFDSTAKLWDSSTGQQVAWFSVGQSDPPTFAVFSPDSSMVVIGSNSKIVQVWDSLNGRPLAHLSEHMTWVRGALFSDDGKVLRTLDWDNNETAWDTETFLRIDRVEPFEPPEVRLHKWLQQGTVGGADKQRNLIWPGAKVILNSRGTHAAVVADQEVTFFEVERPGYTGKYN